MASERIQRRIERLLEQIDAADASGDWQQVVDLSRDVLSIDEENREARAYQQAAERRLGIRSDAGAVGAGLKPARPEDAAAHPGSGPTYTRTFVGREAELRQLHAAFDNAMSGEGSLVMVAGEPGIGKTSLCGQLDNYVASRGGRTLVGHCYEEGSLSLPYLAFVEAMRTYVMERDADSLRTDLGSGAGEVTRIVSEVRERLDVEPSEPTDPEQDRYRLMQAVTSFLQNAASVQPLVIVLEDLHDADRGTLDMLTHVSRNLSGARLMLVATYRDVEVDRSHPLSSALAELRRIANFDRIGLRGLTADEVQRMVGSIAGHDVPWGISEAVYRQTEGNPLFVQEVLRYLDDQGFFARDAGLSRPDIPPEMGLPEGLRDVIGKRLSGLSDRCNGVLSVAAVIGREFSLEVLQRVAGLDEEDLYVALEEAIGVGVVEERSSVGGVVGFRFAHAFFRQTLYEETFAPRRIRMHHQVGEALEEVHSARLEEHASEMAEHFAHSSDQDVLAKSLRYGEMAAKTATAVYAFGEAAGHLERSLQVQEVLDPQDKAKRCDLLVEFGEALRWAGDPRRTFEEVAEEAFRLAEAEGDAGRVSRSCQVALSAQMTYGRGATAAGPAFRIWVDRADKYAAPGTKDRVQVDYFASSALRTEGKLAEARAMTQRGFELAEQLDDPELVSQGAFQLLTRPYAPRNQSERLRMAEKFDDQLREGASPAALYASNWVLLAWGDRAKAEDMWEELLERGAVVDHPFLPYLLLEHEGHVCTLDGRLDAAVEAGRRRIEKAQEIGAQVGEQAFVPGWTWRPLVYLGRTQEALAVLQQRAGDSEQRPAWRTVALAYAGRQSEVREALHRAIQEHRIGPEEGDLSAEYLANLLEAALLVQEAEIAELLASKLAGLWQMSTFVTPISTTPARLLGGAAALLGKPDEARDCYMKALEAAGKIRFRPEIALTHLALAELLLDHFPNERAEAVEHLDFAITELGDMKMQPALERALLLLERQKGTKSRGTSYPDGLSEREVEVLRLIMAGASNQDIAAALFISTNTVANHVRNILTKSNTDNRTGAAAYGIRHGLAED